ncbi:Wzz/FepE/Etk N-terminal domain-containing protein [Salicola sp. Rm-C-2C1-2]|uniref:Wzz/FepE/Etk N-terminal domain-containing protein n=1 Tax=Salicola sp. Rm-C-2C1-2 TaxID=3141321 RepID=UPI0032E3B088
MSEQPTYNAAGDDDEIDLRDLFLTLWHGKWLIISITLVFAVGGVVYALMQPNMYRAEAMVAPATEEQGPKISGQLGSLASMAGVNIGEGGGSKTVIAKQILQSRAFLSDFIRRHELAVPLMATEGWNTETREWIINREVYNPETGEWQQDEEGESLEPTDWDLVKRFSGMLSVSDSSDTGMITVSIQSLSPVAAQQWVDQLIADINEHMRQKDVEEAQSRINYLRNQVDETSITGMQQVFYQLIESETRTVMLANAQNEYVFQTIDPAVVPQEKSGPQRALICILATMLGGMLSVFAVFVRSFIRNLREAPAPA